HMMWSTVPAFVVYFFLFMILGHTSKAASLSSIREVTDFLEANFTISIWSLIPLFIKLLCAWKKVPAILTILLNIAVAV
ncbi:Na+/H+ antiporter NhaC, partial [Enterococcus faecium]